MPQNKLEGLTVSLLDDVAVEDLYFHGNKVRATIGVLNGPLCAPIFEIVVTGPDSIKIQRQSLLIEWQSIKVTENEVQVVRNGRPSVYKITGKDQTKQKGRLP